MFSRQTVSALGLRTEAREFEPSQCCHVVFLSRTLSSFSTSAAATTEVLEEEGGGGRVTRDERE